MMTTEATHAHEEGSRLYVMVWLGLLALTAVEVVLAYVQVFSTAGMLSILMFLSLIKAAMIVAYFMHLRFEKTTLVWSLVPAVTLVIMLLFIFFPDAVRALELRVPQP
jgi:cytochrome c oxidase subunit IV